MSRKSWRCRPQKAELGSQQSQVWFTTHYLRKLSRLRCRSVNLALQFARNGLRSGILDADIYGPSVPTIMGLLEAGEPRLNESKSGLRAAAGWHPQSNKKPNGEQGTTLSLSRITA